ncbi:MAG TPA: RNA polymerase sigma factor [Methylomirabilota bacterium]|nr:RNA polymerase sigma factor [Methylomirabilota bacterium]
MEPSDEALCERVARGEEAAFDLLVGRYQQRAWRLAWSMLHHVEDARDVCQDAFVRVFQSAGTFRSQARFSTWFYRIVVNQCIEHRRRGRPWLRFVPFAGRDDEAGDLLERQPAEAVDPIEGLDKEQAVKRMWAAIDGLSARQRAAVVLYAQDELSTREIASVLSCSEATVRVHLHRALATLRRTMEKVE